MNYEYPKFNDENGILTTIYRGKEISLRLANLLENNSNVWEINFDLWIVENNGMFEVISSQDLSGEKFRSIQGAMQAYGLSGIPKKIK